jgi:hypothetical protein
MERLMFEMRQEIASLKSFIANSSSPRFIRNHQFGSYPPAIELQQQQQQQRHHHHHHQQQQPLLTMPISPVSQPQSFHQTMVFPENQHPNFGEHENTNAQQGHSGGMIIEPPSPAPSPTAQVPMDPSSLRIEPSTSRTPRKRQTPDLTSGDDNNSTDDESPASPPERPNKRINHHDTRCLTIHVSHNLLSAAIPLSLDFPL